MTSPRNITRGDGLRARALRGSMLVIVSVFATNALRLGSNLVLTRLLVPEAFGLMALVQIFVVGMTMMSDLGINLSIIQNKRGEERSFLDTAWSIQILRGVVIWIGTALLAYPVAQVYAEPQLALLLPVVGLNAILIGFTTTKVALANRNLQLGVQITADLVSQALGIAVTILLAWYTGSVWGLVWGGLVGSALKVALQHYLLKGPPDRWHLERAASREIIRFGKFILGGSLAGFLCNQSNQAILGGFVPLADLGVFTVSLVFAQLPFQLVQAASGKVLFPILSRLPTAGNPENRAKVLRARRLILLPSAAAVGLLSMLSVPLIALLYDPRYHDAGPILALLGSSMAAQIAGHAYGSSALARGDSRTQFQLTIIQAGVQVAVSLLLISTLGIVGAALATGLTMLLVYPFKVRVARRYDIWDPLGDALCLGLGLAGVGLAWVLWTPELAAFLADHVPHLLPGGFRARAEGGSRSPAGRRWTSRQAEVVFPPDGCPDAVADDAGGEALLTDRGWTIVRPETLPVPDQLRLLAGARVIVGVEGSALHLRILLAELRGALVLLRRFDNENYATISRARGFRQHDIVGSLQHVAGSETQHRLRDPAATAEILATICGEVAAGAPGEMTYYQNTPPAFAPHLPARRPPAGLKTRLKRKLFG